MPALSPLPVRVGYRNLSRLDLEQIADGFTTGERLFVLRPAQHERCFLRTAAFSVRPEPVEGRTDLVQALANRSREVDWFFVSAGTSVQG